MNASISVITLGVSNLKQAITFYETIGFQRTPFDSPPLLFLMLAAYSWLYFREMN